MGIRYRSYYRTCTFKCLPRFSVHACSLQRTRTHSHHSVIASAWDIATADGMNEKGLEAIPQTSDSREALASVFSVIRNCSVPFGISSETEPNISSTRWRSVSDHKNLTYYFETVKTPNVFWVDLRQIDFGKTPVKRLSVSKNETYAGETSKKFVDTKPFTFAGI